MLNPYEPPKRTSDDQLPATNDNIQLGFRKSIILYLVFGALDLGTLVVIVVLYLRGGMFAVYAVWLGVPLALIGAVFLWIKMPDRWQQQRHEYLRQKRRKGKASKGDR